MLMMLVATRGLWWLRSGGALLTRSGLSHGQVYLMFPYGRLEAPAAVAAPLGLVQQQQNLLEATARATLACSSLSHDIDLRTATLDGNGKLEKTDLALGAFYKGQDSHNSGERTLFALVGKRDQVKEAIETVRARLWPADRFLGVPKNRGSA